ncbi:MAG: VWA domain-containing protein [Asgard group archaeon]|nr:VWA domain-containing protein [Asgard group archaeon]
MIAALDVSGSMSGAKLEGVKQSLISTLKAYSKAKADAIFGMVTFETALRIYSADGEIIEQLSGDILYDIKKLEEKIAQNSWIKNHLPKMTIKTTSNAWQQTISKMVSMGSTALGPAVIAARIMSLASGTGRILLLTDGMANQGVGSLSGASPQGKKFYENIAMEMKNNGIVLDIVGIQGQGSLELKTLALMPEITGGDLFYADLSELQESFSAIAGDQILGRNARIKVIAPEGIAFSNISGVGALLSEMKKGEEITLGGLTKSRSIAFEFSPQKKMKDERIPIQVQIRYRDENDNERIRVIEQELEVTENKEELEKNIDADLIAGYTVQRAAQVMQKDRKKSKKMMMEMRKTLSRTAPEKISAQKYLDEEIEDLENLIENEKRGKPSAQDAIQAASYRMVRKRKK